MQITRKKSAGFSANRASVTFVAAVIWLLAVAGGMAMIFNYSNTPGGDGAASLHWPAESRIALDANRPTLLVFAHPHCPCTRATIRELDQLMASCQGLFSAQVWFVQPAGTPENWTDTDLWRNAAAIPGVTVHRDAAGDEARRFKAETSGQTLLFDHEGKLLFHGGITISRGHEGDNPGLTALAALLNQKIFRQTTTPVFGCPLFVPECQPVRESVWCKP